MNCAHCNKENPDGSQFCNGCGQSLSPLTQPAGHPPDEEERVVWEGSCDPRALLNLWWCLSFLLVVPLLIFPIVAWLQRARRQYRLTTERLTVTTGIFGRSSQDLKLVRIEDINFQQSFFNRMLGVGDLHVLSTDKTDPDLAIFGVKKPEELKETLWKLVREQRKRMVYMEQLNA